MWFLSKGKSFLMKCVFSLRRSTSKGQTPIAYEERTFQETNNQISRKVNECQQTATR